MYVFMCIFMYVDLGVLFGCLLLHVCARVLPSK